MNFADTTFVFLSTVLVMIMTPALAMFYGGMVKTKNTLGTMMHSYACMIIVSLQWILIGYSIAFGPDISGLIGNFQYALLHHVGFKPFAPYSSTIPHSLFMMFQLMFAIITPGLITGAFAERIKFPAFILFILLWTTIIYDPLAHWVWGNGGWIKNLGALDFAGGTVVHISSGASGLVAAIMIGKRKYIKTSPNNLTLTFIGGTLLWFGWFGFNAGSALAINDVAMNAFITTNTAAAAAAAAWITCEWFITKRPTVLGALTGTLAGLVSITPACGFVTVGSSLVIGIIGGIICFFSVSFLKKKFNYDDALDAFGCHGIGGTWGAIATGIFATKAVNSAGANGLLYGNASLVLKQLEATAATYAYSIIGTIIIIKVVSLIFKIRSTDEEELQGLDISIHGERAYHID
ncbi:Amt family ammonium transporter [Clostridium acetobutylicum]|uniref:Ammonium transporter n=1 Tax=Clostridium acetobutylicum (strain ATCC 824 / DSM 792 / JCM 1419 / IAM 19013 / LMG 5710 / NBRC 13948 / NRRL B-527 / VKM B-1787 / 2291 / W) TaxID=272562 RepID=Q97L80_CLOAB|nr:MULTISPECIES: ammonium transporter [Clostridium]AAK78659.1 Ammonium transporter (membrane protein nrgA) [Clostridium acetobutylicum ATCC 824]ADZ19733.1 Ammonium transporter (membrane protein nrgA) [Clostridium acetobutylicum EA 2018]AEI33093.1 ammonium transporter [Clostridium acetobutylicum DSM 1731]AWV80380.1 ammonium transporter [Clostridium acetobutylicum]MBC2392568.1 ammonium transporter [Clostridium acetobutylicum]